MVSSYFAHAKPFYLMSQNQPIPMVIRTQLADGVYKITANSKPIATIGASSDSQLHYVDVSPDASVRTIAELVKRILKEDFDGDDWGVRFTSLLSVPFTTGTQLRYLEAACVTQRKYCEENDLPLFAPPHGICWKFSEPIYDLSSEEAAIKSASELKTGYHGYSYVE